MNKRPLLLAVAVLLLAPAGAAGQVHWETPLHVGPDLTEGLGLHLIDPEPGPGIGAMVTWRRSSIPGGMGFRLGMAEGFRGDVAGFGGIDFSGLLLSRTEEFPLDLMWATGVGAGIGEYALFSFPLGLYVGRGFEGDGVRFIPYAGPRLSLDAHLGRKTVDGRNAEDIDLAFSLDLGGDIVFGNDVAVRFGASVLDHDALSIGVVLPGIP